MQCCNSRSPNGSSSPPVASPRSLSATSSSAVRPVHPLVPRGRSLTWARPALEVQRKRGGSGPLTTYDVKHAYREHLLEKDRGGSDRRAMFIR